MPNLIKVSNDAEIGAVARLEEVMVVAHDPRHQGNAYPHMTVEQAIELIRQLETAVAGAVQNRERADRANLVYEVLPPGTANPATMKRTLIEVA